ncbi:MAG: hypothetical protein K9J16_01600 [Melioribacteraceae bacterium]|nr:hypothetical protein [Melioribacteraceae bacterium]MCF8354840.1 hypothetical protein [Melioribacteraceae bacterium]MCF8392947.1 hypothetical protein [Melioribacteraceae bacterium]MCF8417310.1 hypothetical protein [Melioribacteraceae bacterium]
MKKLLLPIVLLSTLLYAQPSSIQDTVYASTFEEFKVPGDKNIVLANVVGLDFTAQLLDANMNSIRNVEKVWQYPTEAEIRRQVSGGRGTTVQFASFETVEEKGTYYIKYDINVRGEQGSGSRTVYYMVVVDYPTMASAVSLSDKYYYSESEKFGIATVEFSNPNAYSYRVVDGGGNVLSEGAGTVVELDDVLNDIKNVGKNLTVEGLYDGKKFKFIQNGDPTPKESEWTFQIAPLNLEEFTSWLRDDKKQDRDIPILSAYGDPQSTMNVLFTYIGNKESGFVVQRPDIGGLSVTSEPANLLESFNYFPAGSFQFVQLFISQDYLDGIEQYAEIEAKINIRFRTQFGENVNRTYEALLYK